MPSTWQKFKGFLSPQKAPIVAEAPMQRAMRKVSSRKMSEKSAGRSSTIAPLDKTATRVSVIGYNKGPEPDLEARPQVLRADSISSDKYSLSDQPTGPKPNFFDKVTRAAGSSWVFGTMMLLLVVWVFAGFIGGTSDTWQILLQNASSIQVYATDILLLRQQSNSEKSLMTILAEMQSRNQSCDRLIRKIPDCEWMETHKDPAKKIMSTSGRPVEDEEEELLLTELQHTSRIRYVWNKTCHATASALGSLWAFIIYWIGIFFWIGIGPIFQFSNTWQLYVNTATAVILTFTSVFLQNIQQQQEDSLERALKYATKIDAEVEEHLRELTEDTVPNPIFEIPPPKVTRSERFVDYFADIMGSMIGVTITMIVIGVWLSIGKLLEFDDNWWLIIGTFTGLVGFVDGFVLRNVYHREAQTVNAQFLNLKTADERMLNLLNLPHPEMPTEPPASLSVRASRVAGDFCSKAGTTLGSVGIVFALLVIATIMKWSETGQLLCNTPTMIVEGFLLLILIQAHNIANLERGREFSGILKRRLLLNRYVLSLQAV